MHRVGLTSMAEGTDCDRPHVSMTNLRGRRLRPAAAMGCASYGMGGSRAINSSMKSSAVACHLSQDRWPLSSSPMMPWALVSSSPPYRVITLGAQWDGAERSSHSPNWESGCAPRHSPPHGNSQMTTTF